MNRQGAQNGDRRLRAVALVVLVLAAASAIMAASPAERLAAQTGAPAPQTLKKAVWGVTSHNGVSLFPIYRDLGIGIFQTQAAWDQIAPTRPAQPTDPNDPAYVWPAYLDQAIKEAESHGITVMIQIIGSPSWASGGQPRTWPPTQPTDYGDFAAAMSKKYPSVRHWMIWGEPNRKDSFGPVVGAPTTNRTKLNTKQARAPRLYAQLLDAAYGSLKSVSAGNLVIGGNTYQAAGHPVIRTHQWIRYLRLPDGSRPRMDLWGHNPYTYRIPNLKAPQSPRGRVDFSDLGRLAKALDKAFPGPPLRLFLSEFGIPTKRDADLQFSVSRKTSAKWTRAAMRIVRRWGRIYTLGWSVPVDTRRHPQGLLDSSLRPKPAYAPFKAG